MGIEDVNRRAAMHRAREFLSKLFCSVREKVYLCTVVLKRVTRKGALSCA